VPVKYPIKPFYFKDKTHEEIADILDEEYPIILKYNKDLINRVYERYPVIEKYKIALIINTFFSCLRSNLILGKMISFESMFNNMHLDFHLREKEKTQIALSAKLLTPMKIKNG
jgi:nucleoid DNA-binding protein